MIKVNEKLLNNLDIDIEDVSECFVIEKCYVSFQVWLIGYSNDSEELLKEFDVLGEAIEFAKNYKFKISEHKDMKRSSQINIVVETSIGEYENGKLTEAGDINFDTAYEEVIYTKTDGYIEYNIYFKNSEGKGDVTSAEVRNTDNWETELINLILSWKEEMDIIEITEIEFVQEITARRHAYDNGEIDTQEKYQDYCKNWYYDHRNPEFDGMEPAGYDEWLHNEFQDWLDAEDGDDEE